MNATNSSNRLQRLGWLAVMSLLFAVTLSACDLVAQQTGQDEPTVEVPTSAPTLPPSNEPVRGQATINSLDILILESFPVQVNVEASGELGDSCTQIDEIITLRDENQFRVAVTTVRPPDLVCTQAIVPFTEVISLDVAGLPAGTYNVSVNGVTETFTLDVDNVIPEEAAATEEVPAIVTEPAPESAQSGSIGGLVWHDICLTTGSTVAADATLPEGCVLESDGTTVIADGILSEGEPGIPGVEVHMLISDCTAAVPGEELIATTDESGAYRFDNLEAGSYCVFLDVADEANAPVLEEGKLTFPTSNGIVTNSVTIELAAGEVLDDVNFGFDFQFRPLPEANAADCTNSTEFVQDLTVPDDTVFPPGEEFEAAWRLRNNGTCTWTTEYSLAPIGGDAMGVTEPQPLPNAVAPGQTIDASVMLTAPATPGTYRSNWQIADEAGEPFGIGGFIEDAFWVQIVVEEGAEVAATPLPGSARIGGVVWEDICFFNANGAPSNGCLETPEDSGFFIGDGTYLAGEGPLVGVTVDLGEGACPDEDEILPDALLASTVTDDEGLYRFEGLEAGLYCVAINALSDENVNLLIPGNWTYPAQGVGRAAVRLVAGEESLEVDFGWDFQE